MFYVCITLSHLGTQDQKSSWILYKSVRSQRHMMSCAWRLLFHQNESDCLLFFPATMSLGILLSPLQNYNNNWNWLSSYLKNRPTYSLQSQAKPMSCHMSAEGIAPLIFKLYILPKLQCLLSSRWHFKQGLSLKKNVRRNLVLAVLVN